MSSLYITVLSMQNIMKERLARLTADYQLFDLYHFVPIGEVEEWIYEES